ncbi:response regulator transcription factor [Daejeonella sp.]|jgi:two-component system OmpR family response regulator|uniref:response regulator transcription factor n=1 Tax=Daejeonella sp. TaxID=2805397 RepID=UPI00378412DF
MNDRKLKVLLVEDEHILRENITQFLELKKFKVIQAKNGLEADYILKKANPDVIICDISMPFMNGIQLLKQVRKNDQYNHIPFIFLTAKAEKDDLRTGMISGADDYIIKPFTFSELFNSIQKRIERLSQIRNNNHLSNVLEESISLSTEEEHKALSQIVMLSKTEIKIMRKIATGLTSLLISQDLNISIRTVENHRHNICKKLNLKGSNSLIKFALKFKTYL